MADPVTVLGIGIKAVGWVISPIISELFKKCSNYLNFDTSEKLRQLGPKVVLLERVMEVFEKIPERIRMVQLFEDLKSAFYEAEDILDDFEYHCLEKKVRDDKFKSDGSVSVPMGGWVKKLLPKGSPRRNKETTIPKKDLKVSLEKIEDIINNAYKFVEHLNMLTLGDCNGSQAAPANSGCAVTTAAPPPIVFGRDKDCDRIIAMLHEKEGEGEPNSNNGLCYSVVGIHGIGGSGKSTLAQLVCAREKKDSREKMYSHFNLVMWVHVSQSFSVGAIFKEIFEAATGNSCPQLNNLNTLHGKLEEKLQGKRFLLVLDDVWCNIRDERKQEDLRQLLSPLKAGEAGSKILVTSRTEDALLVMGATKPSCVAISDLDDNVFVHMLMHYALEGTIVDDHVRGRLAAIGADIAKKLRLSPLAARIVGGRLGRRPTAEFWTTVKNGKLVDGTMGTLCIFPRRHHLIRDELVNLWVAEGFIRSTNEGEEMEDVCRGYFDELVSTSFLQPGGKDFYNDKDYYLVHDLLHDLAEIVAGSDCFRIENVSIQRELWRGKGQKRDGGIGDVPQDVRHLFVQNYDGELITEKICKLENLRTLIIYTVRAGTTVEKKVTESIFKRLRKLRVLAIALNREDDALIKEPDMLSVPESINQLKHLRYLALRTNMSCRVTLPDTLTKLYHMQLLDFGQCKKMVFPSAELINLRHVFCSIVLDFPYIGRLISLQTIPNFTVWNIQGYTIKQLRDLNKLGGSLEIRHLENVKSKIEALEANLAAKERLTHLSLGWGVGARRRNLKAEAEVFEGLCPPMWLESLYIYNYRGLTYPNWMVGKQNGGPKDLHRLQLHGWSQLGPGPVFEAFTQLCSLTVWNCSWNALPGNMDHLTSLKALMICECLNICSLPILPQSLEEFTLKWCSDEFMRTCETAGHPNWQKIEDIPKQKIIFPEGNTVFPFDAVFPILDLYTVAWGLFVWTAASVAVELWKISCEKQLLEAEI
ncbi:putative disease resistance protein RGA4 [Lolium perenne]|uniref:putative disease resistance protein RGA4 n=1 Tax=Lolium perenne TaxID=4522 RepID=UPI0021F5E4E8|nr:putative disease resistance protein RGA3 [Lolium perenne]